MLPTHRQTSPILYLSVAQHTAAAKRADELVLDDGPSGWGDVVSEAMANYQWTDGVNKDRAAAALRKETYVGFKVGQHQSV